MDNKLYHTYLDEGGWFGSATLCITSKKLKSSKKEFHMSNYYLGKMKKSSIIRYLELFHETFPNCKINFDELSEIELKITREI